MKKMSCIFLFFLAVHFTHAQVDITNSGILYITGSTDTVSVTGNFTNTSSASFTNNGRFYAKQNYTNSQVSTPVGTGELTMNGTGTQLINTTSTSPFYKLTINKASGLTTLASAVTINNTLTFSAGKLSLGSYDLNMANNAVISGASASSYAVAVGSGVLKQQVISSGSKMFPVGTTAAYTPVTVALSMLSTTDVFNVRMLPAVYVNGTSGGAVNANAVNATWMVSETVNGGSNATLTCQWPASLELTDFNRVFSRLAHYSASVWDYGLLSIIASGSDPYTVTRSGFTSFSPFAVTMFMAVLPAGSLELSGKNLGNENDITWSTSEEHNTSYFVIESSKNGVDFEEAGRVHAAGYSSSVRRYNFVHKAINGTSYYYRLRQVDVDGKWTYSKTIRINVSAVGSASMYPNPVKDKAIINFTVKHPTVVTMLVCNTSGNVVFTTKQLYNQGDYAVPVNLDRLPSATYILQLKDEHGILQTIPFIKVN